MKTKYGISYDLAEDEYSFEWHGVTFWFSSAPHLAKFQRELNTRITRANGSFTRRYHVPVFVGEWAVMQLYMQTETRGFHITVAGVDYYNAHMMKFVGGVEYAALSADSMD